MFTKLSYTQLSGLPQSRVGQYLQRVL